MNYTDYKNQQSQKEVIRSFREFNSKYNSFTKLLKRSETSPVQFFNLCLDRFPNSWQTTCLLSLTYTGGRYSGPRAVGATTAVAIGALWKTLYGTGSTVVVVGHGQADYTYRLIDDIIQELPYSLQKKFSVHSKKLRYRKMVHKADLTVVNSGNLDNSLCGRAIENIICDGVNLDVENHVRNISFSGGQPSQFWSFFTE